VAIIGSPGEAKTPIMNVSSTRVSPKNEAARPESVTSFQAASTQTGTSTADSATITSAMPSTPTA